MEALQTDVISPLARDLQGCSGKLSTGTDGGDEPRRFIDAAAAPVDCALAGGLAGSGCV